MKKLIALALAVFMLTTVAAGCGKQGETPPAETPPAETQQGETPSAETPPAETQQGETPPAETQPAPPEVTTVPHKGKLLMATTTSTDNTGLLDYLAPLFLADTGWELEWTSVGTGEALQLGMDGQVDIVLVHSKAREEAFVADGYGVERFQVMYNDYVIVGPEGGPVAYTDDVVSVFNQIFEEDLTFVSRGDDSGTHTQEKNIWAMLGGADYVGNSNYISAGAGMSATIIMADEMQGYTLSDRGTWLSTKKNADNNIELEVVCEGDAMLLNQYGVIAVSPEMYPDINNEAASAFVEWICSPAAQTAIGQFGVSEYGEPLFTPNAL